MSEKRVSIPVGHIDPNKWNPNVMDEDTFQALKVDIISDDYDPIVVSPENIFYGDPDLPTDRYVIVDGEHRWRAAVEGDVGFIDVDVRPFTEAEAKSYNYRRNRERGHIDPLKEARLFDADVQALLEDGMGVLEAENVVAESYLVSRSLVASRRSLLRVSEPVVKMFRAPEAGLKELEEEGELPVPRGTITASHLEALASLPQEDQEEFAKDILERDWTVRRTEDAVRQRRREIERRERIERIKREATQPNCPICGVPGSMSEWDYSDDNFHCQTGNCPLSSWPPNTTEEAFLRRVYPEKAEALLRVPAGPGRIAVYREKPEEEVERIVEEVEEKAKVKVRPNPRYIRRMETDKELSELIRGWIALKMKQLDRVRRISIVGFRGDEAVRIEFPRAFGRGLSFSVGEEREGWGFDGKRSFSFDIESKTYKSLREKSKLDISDPSPERRARLHRFFDEVVRGEEDPWLPEDPEEVEEILRRYGEADKEPLEPIAPTKLEDDIKPLSENEHWILHCSVDDPNWRSHLNGLDLNEVERLLSVEKRKTARKKLEAKRRILSKA